MTPRTQFFASVGGTILVAVFCFTPILVIALAAVGLAAFTPYLDVSRPGGVHRGDMAVVQKVGAISEPDVMRDL